MKHIKVFFLCLLIPVLLGNISLAKTIETDEASAVNVNIIQFTQAENEFIKNHPVINLGVDPKFVPYEFIDSDGVYKGIAADYINLISQKTGLKFIAAQNLTWSEAYEKAVEKKLDVLPSISKTAQREQHFIFSNAYFTFQRVIFINENNKTIKSFNDLIGSTVAVQTDSSHHSYLSSYENINLSLYMNVEDALKAVSDGTASAFVGNFATSSYLIKSYGITNLKYIAIDTEEPQSLYFAVRNDWPELVSIINKALSDIIEEDRIAINNKWIGVSKGIDYSEIIKIAAIIGSVIILILSVSFFWIIRLKKEIEKRKKIQLDLEKARKDAEDANNFKSNFMARMSHEIRTPLNAITGMSYLLKKTNITLTQKMYIDRITQASTNMLSIINDILDFSKIEAGKVELENISFNMDQVIQDVVNIVSYKIEEQEIGLRLSKDPTMPTWFFGDAKRIEQILINILNNSAKFTTSGEVSLDIRLIAKEADKYHLAFTIKDTGIGMSEEQVKNLFEPFTQGDVSINRRFGGTGLGLSIVKNLVDMMNGQIQVYSTAGEGSTFIIHLSLMLDKVNEDEYKKLISADHFKNIKTLVLEKSGSNMNMIDSYLSSFGMDCELTTSPTSALSMLEAANSKFTKSFDLLIIDYETPSDGGFKFVEALRNNKKITKLPKIIMLLPMMREDLFDKLNENSIDIGIGKPIIPSILFNGILDIFKLKAITVTKTSENDNNNLFLNNNCVLVVEDNKTNQLIAKSLLQQVGIKALIASDGKEGLEIFSQYISEIDLILMDLHMPVMNGYEAAIEIRKISESVPIVAMTADVILGVKEKCEQSGIYHYISKPFDPDRFIQTVINIIMQSKNKNEMDKIDILEILDMEIGLKNLGGNKELYEAVLVEYYNENKETLDKLSQVIEKNQYSDAVQIVHKVKSSSGSIGAKLLYNLSVRLQEALKNNSNSEIESLYGEFSQILTALLYYIKNQSNNNG